MTKTISEEVQTLELQVKDIKSTVLGMFNDVEETMDKKKLKETKKMVYKQSENINKETELIRRNQFLELKSTVTEMKNSFSL